MSKKSAITFGSAMLRLGLVVLAFMVSIVCSLVMAWAMGKIYGWFVAGDLGPGPSLEGWFGISSLVHLALIAPLANVKRKKADDDDGALDAIALGIGLAAATLIITLGCYLTGLICGWV